MRIANVACTYPPYRGGIGTAASEFTSLLKERGHEITTFTADYGKKVNKKKDKEDKVIRLKTLVKHGNGAFLPQLFWRLKYFDYIYLNYPFFGAQEVIWFLLRFFLKKKKLIIHYHMDVMASSFLTKILSWPTKLLFGPLFSRADLIIASSLDYVQNGDLARIYEKQKKKFIAIPYGVDVKKFFPKEKRGDDKFIILFVGGLDRAHYFKGINVLFKAISKLNREDPDWQVNIVGDGNLRQIYEKTAVNLGFLEKIIFLGKVPDKNLPEKYRGASCLVLPSINKCEAFGIVLIEAMASGIPLVASDLPGVRSVFQDGRQGLLVEPRDADDLKNKLKYLMDNKGGREKMGRAARQLAKEKYDREKIGDRLAEALENL